MLLPVWLKSGEDGTRREINIIPFPIDITSCQVYQTLEDMQTKVAEKLQTYFDTMIAKLTGFPYFVKTANAI